jgi:two-component system sensor histidine kinase VicK
MSHFEGRDQEVIYDKPVEGITVPVDTEYIRMAIGNIIDNASKYTPSGKKICISVTRSSDKSVAVCIQDEGVGIPKDSLDKLFKKFSRIDNPLSVKVGGTGLGLYWANEVIELHGGNIQVESVVSEGTTFTITLPVTPIHPTAPKNAEPASVTGNKA